MTVWGSGQWTEPAKSGGIQCRMWPRMLKSGSHLTIWLPGLRASAAPRTASVISLQWLWVHRAADCRDLSTFDPITPLVSRLYQRFFALLLVERTVRCRHNNNNNNNNNNTHLCLTGLSEVAMPSSNMWLECKLTLQHTRPCYAKSSYRSVDPQTLMETSTRPTMYQMDRPTPSWQQCFHCDSVEASHRLRSLESDAMVPADYALTTTTTHQTALLGPTSPSTLGVSNLPRRVTRRAVVDWWVPWYHGSRTVQLRRRIYQLHWLVMRRF